LQRLFSVVEIGWVTISSCFFKLLIAGDADPGDQFKGGEEEKSPLETILPGTNKTYLTGIIRLPYDLRMART
jgi:hypothetical protein